uniref:Leucine rich repeats-containing protein n=1 Tax=Trepomonas sp. PC1 TaxID=1076344 RepID=A0A146JZQ5_9EUKA|eukprot:JAP89997.1 Hypothetical protein TPC1_30508 [Trepomonas sp. PC1]
MSQNYSPLLQSQMKNYKQIVVCKSKNISDDASDLIQKINPNILVANSIEEIEAGFMERIEIDDILQLVYYCQPHYYNLEILIAKNIVSIKNGGLSESNVKRVVCPRLKKLCIHAINSCCALQRIDLEMVEDMQQHSIANCKLKRIKNRKMHQLQQEVMTHCQIQNMLFLEVATVEHNFLNFCTVSNLSLPKLQKVIKVEVSECSVSVVKTSNSKANFSQAKTKKLLQEFFEPNECVEDPDLEQVRLQLHGQKTEILDQNNISEFMFNNWLILPESVVKIEPNTQVPDNITVIMQGRFRTRSPGLNKIAWSEQVCLVRICSLNPNRLHDPDEFV